MDDDDYSKITILNILTIIIIMVILGLAVYCIIFDEPIVPLSKGTGSRIKLKIYKGIGVLAGVMYLLFLIGILNCVITNRFKYFELRNRLSKILIYTPLIMALLVYLYFFYIYIVVI